MTACPGGGSIYARAGERYFLVGAARCGFCGGYQHVHKGPRGNIVLEDHPSDPPPAEGELGVYLNGVKLRRGGV